MQELRTLLRTLSCGTLLALSIAGGRSAMAGENTAWKAVASSGGVEQRASDAPSDAAWQVVARGDRLPTATLVRTGNGGRVTLTRDRSLIALDPDSVVELPDRPRPGLETSILQAAGSVLYEVDSRQHPYFEVITPFLVAGVKGTTFLVTVNDDYTAVTVKEGLVEVTSLDDGEVFEVRPGESVIRGVETQEIEMFEHGQGQARKEAQRLTRMDEKARDLAARRPDVPGKSDKAGGAAAWEAPNAGSGPSSYSLEPHGPPAGMPVDWLEGHAQGSFQGDPVGFGPDPVEIDEHGNAEDYDDHEGACLSLDVSASLCGGHASNPGDHGGSGSSGSGSGGSGSSGSGSGSSGSGSGSGGSGSSGSGSGSSGSGSGSGSGGSGSSGSGSSGSGSSGSGGSGSGSSGSGSGGSGSSGSGHDGSGSSGSGSGGSGSHNLTPPVGNTQEEPAALPDEGQAGTTESLDRLLSEQAERSREETDSSVDEDQPRQSRGRGRGRPSPR